MTIRCNAPCIVNASTQFRLVFCGKEPGHNGTHSSEAPGRHGPIGAVIHWGYLGKSEAGGNYAPPLSERCRVWVHLAPIRELLPSSIRDIGAQELLVLRETEAIGYCCEKTPGHDGGHTRSGFFGPLGIKWQVAW